MPGLWWPIFLITIYIEVLWSRAKVETKTPARLGPTDGGWEVEAGPMFGRVQLQGGPLQLLYTPEIWYLLCSLGILGDYNP